MNSSLMLYDASFARAISRNVGREKAPWEGYPGELSSVPDLLRAGRDCCRGERRRFIRAEYVGDRLAGLALSSANAKRQRSTR